MNYVWCLLQMRGIPTHEKPQVQLSAYLGTTASLSQIVQHRYEYSKIQTHLFILRLALKIYL